MFEKELIMSLIIGALFLILLSIIYDWLLFKLRGRCQPDEENSPVITDAKDAGVQRYIDLFVKKKK